MTTPANVRLRWFAGAVGVAVACVLFNLRTDPRAEADEKPDAIDAQFATKVKPFIDGKQIVKVVVVPDKLVNIVVK